MGIFARVSCHFKVFVWSDPTPGQFLVSLAFYLRRCFPEARFVLRLQNRPFQPFLLESHREATRGGFKFGLSSISYPPLNIASRVANDVANMSQISTPRFLKSIKKVMRLSFGGEEAAFHHFFQVPLQSPTVDLRA